MLRRGGGERDTDGERRRPSDRPFRGSERDLDDSESLSELISLSEDDVSLSELESLSEELSSPAAARAA